MKLERQDNESVDRESALELSQFLIAEIEAAKNRRRQIRQWAINSICLIALGVVSWGAWHREKNDRDELRDQRVKEAGKYSEIHLATERKYRADKWLAMDIGHPDGELAFRIQGLNQQGAFGVKDQDWERRRQAILDYWPLAEFPFDTAQGITYSLGSRLVLLHGHKMNEEKVVELRQFAAKIKSEKYRDFYLSAIENSYFKWRRSQTKTKKSDKGLNG